MPRPTHSARLLTLAIALAAGNTPALGGGESLLERWAAHRCAADGGVYGCWLGQVALGRWLVDGVGATGMDVVGGVPAGPRCWPTSKVSSGPSGLPMFTAEPLCRSAAGTRCPLTYIPLRLPLSTATQRP